MRTEVTLFLPGGNASLKFDHCTDVTNGVEFIRFTNRQGMQCESNLAYLIAREKEIAN